MSHLSRSFSPVVKAMFHVCFVSIDVELIEKELKSDSHDMFVGVCLGGANMMMNTEDMVVGWMVDGKYI